MSDGMQQTVTDEATTLENEANVAAADNAAATASAVDSPASGTSDNQAPTDPDERALWEAIREAEAEEAAAAQTQDGDAAAKDQPKAGDAQASGKPGMIPKPRFDEAVSKERERLEQAQREAAYWRGVAEASRSTSPATTTAKPDTATPSPAPADQPQDVAALRGQIKSLAAEYDAGTITLAEYEDKKGALEDAIFEVRARSLTPRETAKPEADLYLQEKTEQVLADHPYVALITDKTDLDWLQRKAESQIAAKRSEYEAQGYNFAKPGARENLLLRQTMAELTDVYGPALTGKTLPPKTTAQPGTTKPALSPQAKARADKLNLAATMPPDTSRLGTTSEAGTITEADIEAMSEEELDALPRAVRDKFLGT